MKRLNNFYDKMISYSNANYVFNRIKNNCHNKKRVFAFLKYKNSNIIDILFKLKNQDYTFSNFGIFLINEKKYRIIMSENINDKIVNQMISYFILLPSFKNLIDTNIATRKNKGTSYGYKKINILQVTGPASRLTVQEQEEIIKKNWKNSLSDKYDELGFDKLGFDDEFKDKFLRTFDIYSENTDKISSDDAKEAINKKVQELTEEISQKLENNNKDIKRKVLRKENDNK